ncbi:MAG: DUF1569 domain-containing protein [Cyclobacteriaceae bacterium]|nr:DUF1569 domain-containing protein [Cyclobacteriaceae bacterium]
MDFPDIFTSEIASKMTDRINRLSLNTKPQWGKMNCPQMLAHCNVAYEMIYDQKHKKPNFLMALFIKAFVKDIVVSNKPYKHNSPTAPAFVIKGERDFDSEKKRLVDYIDKTEKLGSSSFENKESLSFGRLNLNEWNNMLYKHLDHHLTQFGV